MILASSMNLLHGVNSGGVGVDNLKGSLGRANSSSNVPGVKKSNQGKKPFIVASQAGPMLASSAYVALPSFREVPTSEKPNLFIRKLNMCCVVFDFSDLSKNLKEKDIKRQTLLELVEYITMVTSKFNEILVQEIMKMVSVNLFRTFPSGNLDSKIPESYVPEEEEPTMEPSWPHLQIVYEFLLREREYLKTILHRIYGNFMVHRTIIRKAINNIFFRFIFKTKRHNGVAELLKILGSIINGFVLSLKEEHKLFLVRALIPLHKPKCVLMYHQQLSNCITQFVEKDIKLVDTVIIGLLKYWPITNSLKEVMFLGELEEFLEATQAIEILPPSRSMSSLLNPVEQSPIPSPIHVGGSHEHFDTSGGGSSITFYSLFRATMHEKGTNMYFLKQQKENIQNQLIPCGEMKKKTLRKKYDECDTDDERKKKCPKKTKPEDWVRFVDLTSIEEVKASWERNKINRSKMLTPHTAGIKGYSEWLMKWSDFFVVGHTCSDGTFPITFVEEKVIAVKDIITKNPQSKYLDVDHDPLAQVFGPMKKSPCYSLRSVDSQRMEPIQEDHFASDHDAAEAEESMATLTEGNQALKDAAIHKSKNKQIDDSPSNM
ncbi:hypothetical protein GIB67_019025 [Kingdonia uniflora]|uniref:Serine/threonine protein phosphatase 2A regulatory subunit n=1 Tax=Kingdonia uniflora TaxID=39325 RepID=A0A7J7MZE5_9MAGN|nr:hypothetical protein GIB67_019025 [Kingdonia uniflora]